MATGYGIKDAVHLGLLNTTSYYIAHNRRRVSCAVRQWLNTFSTDEITDANVGKYLLWVAMRRVSFQTRSIGLSSGL